MPVDLRGKGRGDGAENFVLEHSECKCPEWHIDELTLNLVVMLCGVTGSVTLSCLVSISAQAANAYPSAVSDCLG